MPKGLQNSIVFSILHVHGDLCKHLGIDLSTDPQGLSVFFLVNYLLFKCYNFDRGYISFSLSMPKSSSDLIASESCNRWKVKLVL